MRLELESGGRSMIINEIHSRCCFPVIELGSAVGRQQVEDILEPDKNKACFQSQSGLLAIVPTVYDALSSFRLFIVNCFQGNTFGIKLTSSEYN